MKKINYVIFGTLIVLVVAASGCTQTTQNNTTTGDVKAMVSYSGSWNGGASGLFGYRSISGTGNQTFDLGNINGPVTVTATKSDGSSNQLTVSIIKDGNTVASQSTSYPYAGTSATAIL